MPEKTDERPTSPDAGAYEHHYETWSEPIYRYLVHLVGSGTVADDLFQDTWMKAIENHAQLRDSSRFGPWIFRIARNLAFNHLRTYRRKTQVWNVSSLRDDEAADTFLADQADDTQDPRRQAIDRERREIVLGVIEDLDPLAREMLQLRYFEQLTLSEVSEVLQVPLGTVCTKVHRSLKVIREKMWELGYQDIKAI